MSQIRFGLILLILFLGSTPLASGQTENSDSFYFIQITDTHFGSPSSLDRIVNYCYGVKQK